MAELTYETVLNELAASLNGPINLTDLISMVLARKPVKAKNPAKNVKLQLRSHSSPFIFLDSQTLLPIHAAMKGVRFRLPLGQHVIPKGQLEMELLSSYLPMNFKLDQVRFVDAQERDIPTTFRSVSETTFADLGPWLRFQKATRHDDLLVTVLNWQAGICRLEIEPQPKRHPALIQARDRLLADLIYAILENAPNELVWVERTLPLAYARLPEKEGCPPHHWTIVLKHDGRFRFNDYQIRYFDGKLSPIESLLYEAAGQAPPRFLRPVTPKDEKFVYRFKAAFAHNASIWREVEILGGQTLADLNFSLMQAFQHIPGHMAGFWKFVQRRGDKIRYRELELGDVDSFGKGSGTDIKIAAIGLRPGEKLKYVYDFGDWITHILTLKAIYSAEEGVDYPREVARNRPRYRYCLECLKKGRQTIATQYCVNCTEECGEEMVYCDECIDEHENHYVVIIRW